MNFDPGSADWTNWQWQTARRCTDPETLLAWGAARSQKISVQSETFQLLLKNYRMGITPYYFQLIETFDDSDPIFRQVVPSVKELTIEPEELEDPIGDENPGRGSRPLKALIHRYDNRVLLLPTALCAVYCRFCFRKRLVGDTAHNAREEDLQAAFAYIRKHSEIEEVILTGGDPLTLSDTRISRIITRLNAIPHLRTLRIHTRLPVVNPYRLTSELADILTAGKQPVWLATHFNHPREITATAKDEIAAWIDRGIPFLNQSVLLRGVNDTPAVMRELLMTLISIRIKPYYLHQADLVRGTGHLRVPVQRGLQILKELQGTIPGYALPHYVLDQPGGYGKIPLQNTYDQTFITKK